MMRHQKFLLLFFCLFVFAFSVRAQTNTTMFSGLPAAGTITGSELIPLEQNNVTKKATASQLTLGSMILGINSGGTGLSAVGASGTCLTSNGIGLTYGPCGGGGGGETPGGITGQLQYNNNGSFGGYGIGSGLSVVGGNLIATGGGGGSSPSGVAGNIQINGGNGQFAPLQTDTQASFKAHNDIENGLSYDPRAYGALCSGYNTFATNGSTVTFTYTIPFTGTSSIDNSSFFVFYEPTTGFGTATILNTSQFSVTGVNSGSGGTITLNSAPPAGNVLVVVHDDAAGIVAAATAAVATGGYVAVPDGCTTYGSQANGMQLPEGAQLIGQGFTPNYGFQGQGIKPIMRVIAPSGFAPNFGINISGINQQFFEGFEITTNVPGNNSLGFLDVPVLIGANGPGGAGGGQSPGIVAQYMTFNAGSVGFGAPIGGNSAYIFAVLRFNNFIANNVGIYGPLSDFVVVGNDFASNGAFGTYGSAGGWVIGPLQGAPGAAGAGRADSNRFEFNLEGVVVQDGALITFDDNQFDGNTYCGLDLNTLWTQINIVGGWFRGNANGGGSSYRGVTTAGRDAHICLNGGSGSGGLHLTNVQFQTNFAEGHTAPIGSNNATTPPYVLDFNASPANNNDVTIDQGEAQFATGNSGASITDFAIYRQGRPTNLQINTGYQPVQGKLANGTFPSQARGFPSNSWSALDVFGDALAFNNQNLPTSAGFGGLVGKSMGIGPTYFVTDDFSHFDCDIVNLNLVPNTGFSTYNAPLMLWLPSASDPGFGAGAYTAHEQDTNSCRLGALTWATVPTNFKTFAQNASACTPTGSWSNSSSYAGYYGLTSSTNGDTLSCSVTNNGGPFYLWYLMQGSNGGTFTWQLDGGPVSSSVATQGNNAFTFPIGTTSQTLGAIRIPVPTGTTSHTILATVTSSTSSSNTVTIEGIGTPPGVGYPGTTPTLVLGGQVNTNVNAPQPAAVAAFNTDQYTQATQLAADGLSVNFANVQAYINNSTDYTTINKVNTSGQLHIADAFGAVVQDNPVSMNATNPLNYGASCNTQVFANSFYSSGNSGLTINNGTKKISVHGYTFQPGVATQNGGGDVGKVIDIFDSTEQGTTDYIASVNSDGTANVGNTTFTQTGTVHIAIMGGYPSNPNDPSTAQDDTAAIQAASNAAQLGNGQVFLPPNCLVHNLQMASHTTLIGAAGTYNYGSLSGNPNFTMTPLFVAATGFSDDVDKTNNKARNMGINVGNTTDVGLKNFTLVCPTFPITTSLSGLSLSGIGWNNSTDLDPDHVKIDNVTVFLCPVGYGIPFGNNVAVTFTGSISGTTMNVTAITSTNFAKYNSETDFLAVGRTVTGTGVPANETIIAMPVGTTLGNYTVSIGTSVSSETLTSPAQGGFTSGTITDTNFNNNGIGTNGSLSDVTFDNVVWTGNFVYGMYLGPPQGSAGSSANRILGGRFEENGSTGCVGAGLQIDNAGDQQLTGVQFQFNNGPGIVTVGGLSDIQMTGGMLQGNCPSGAQISLGSSTTNFALSGVSATKQNFFVGGNSAYLISNPASSANVDYVSVDGGDMRNAFNTSFTNWLGNTPVHYRQVVSGLNYVDTTQAGLSVGTSGAVGIGTAAPNSNTALDMGTLTSAALLPVGTTGQEPGSPKVGMIRYNSTTNVFEGYQGSSPAWAAFGGLTASSVNTFTNKTFDTAGTGNVFKINGTQITAISGTTGTVGTTSGSFANGDCLEINSSGNIVSAGGTCSTGSGSGTVISSPAGQVAYYQNTAATVIGTSSLVVANGEVGIGTATPQGVFNVNTAGAASNASILASGTIFTGGTGTTTFPYVYISPLGATAPSTWSTAGTALGFNMASGFTGNFIDAHLNGAGQLFTVDNSGNITSHGFIALSGTTARISAATPGGNQEFIFGVGTTDTFTITGNGGWQLGAIDASSPVAQSLKMQSQITTANTAGQNFTITGSLGTGTGAGGSIIIQTGKAGSSGSTQNTATTALTIDGSQNTTFSGLAILKGFTVGTLPVGITGATAYVTDQTTACAAPGGALTGGGGVTCPVFFNGSSWVGM